MSAETLKKMKTLSNELEPSLPVELLLEIVALTDPTTVVRCAATGRILRRAILEPAFRRRLAAEDGLDPALLLGISFREHGDEHGNVKTRRIIQTPGPVKLHARMDDCNLWESFKPVASRDSLLLILRRRGALPVPELCACDTLTGHVTPLPPTSLPDAYHHVVLSVGRSYELLVVDKNARFLYQTFSSKDGRRSAVREVSVPYLTVGNADRESYCSAVLGRTVFLPRCVQAIFHWDRILALDLDAGEATLMELPRGCITRMGGMKRDSQLRLAAVRGRLCLLVAESGGIAMWTLTAATWSRQVVMSSVEIARQMGLPAHPYTLLALSVVGFGERSGAVILSWTTPRRCASDFFRLDLGTEEEARVVTRLVTHGHGVMIVKRLFLHEIGFASLLQAMKPF